MSIKTKPKELAAGINFKTPSANWMDNPVEFKKGCFNYAGAAEALRYLDQPNPRKWQADNHYGK